jgi:predicted DNA-binding transcriptional regulator YafY
MNERRLTIMRMLNAKKKMKAKELADQFQVSIRTIQRDFQYLQQIGFPLYTEVGVNGGYTALPNRILPPLQLTEYEALGLFMMMDFLEFIPDLPYGKVRNHLAEQYLVSLPDDVQETIYKMKNYISFQQHSISKPAPFTSEILMAASEKRKISITYQSKHSITNSIIFPIGVYFEKGFWYMPAVKNESFRLYRVDRVLSLQALDEVNSSIPSLKGWLKQKDERETIEVKLKFTEFGVRLSETDPHFNTVENNEWKEQVPLEELSFLARKIFSFGAEVEVLAPKELQEMMIKEAKACLSLYKNKSEF